MSPLLLLFMSEFPEWIEQQLGMQNMSPDEGRELHKKLNNLMGGKMKTTITEALAELKTISKRVEKKRSYINSYLYRQEALKDPLEKDGGSAVVIARERQAIKDLEFRHVAIRLAIQKINHETPVTVEGITNSLADWLTWRKEVAPEHQRFLLTLRSQIDQARKATQQRGGTVVTAAGDATKPTDVIVNVNEAQLAEEMEKLESILGGLDGQLSLKNATVTIEI